MRILRYASEYTSKFKYFDSISTSPFSFFILFYCGVWYIFTAHVPTSSIKKIEANGANIETKFSD